MAATRLCLAAAIIAAALVIAPPFTAAADASLVQSSGTRLVDFFPKDANGENGIMLQALLPGGAYGDLTHSGDYLFNTPGAPWSIPMISLNNQATQDIYVHPSAVSQVGAEKDPVIGVTLDGSFPEVRITGRAQAANGYHRYYIYTGAAGYAAPLWETWNSGTFDITLSYVDGDQVFFGVDAGSSDVNDWGHWYEIGFQGVGTPVPEPCSLFVVSLGLGSVLAKVRRRS